MLEDKIRHKKKRIKSHAIRVFLDAEYDPGIKVGRLSTIENKNKVGEVVKNDSW